MYRENSKVPNARKNKPKFEDFKFVQIRLYEADKDTFEKWRVTAGQDVDILLARLALDGYKMSVSWDDNNSCYIASHTCLNEKDENYCLILTSRSDDMFEAMALNAFKHFKMCHDCVWPMSENASWG